MARDLLKTQSESHPRTPQSNRQKPEITNQAYQSRVLRSLHLAGFDFSAADVNEATIRQLHTGDFVDRAENVVLIGGPGTGKTHVAIAMAVQAIEHHRRKVRFWSTVDLVNALEQEKTANRAGQPVRSPNASCVSTC